jgi:hypothetical protein
MSPSVASWIQPSGALVAEEAYRGTWTKRPPKQRLEAQMPVVGRRSISGQLGCGERGRATGRTDDQTDARQLGPIDQGLECGLR